MIIDDSFPRMIFKEIFEETILFQEKEFFKEICEIYAGDITTGLILEDTRTKDGSFYEGTIYDKNFKEIFSTRRFSDISLFLFKTVYQS
jgi:hypothetical protein